GILAIKKENAQIAPIHMLDEETGIYNESFIKKYFENEEMMLVKGVERVQGLIVEKGNPENIKTLEDIVSKKLKIVNRQRGSGTRILFDYLSKKSCLNVKEIDGYEYEVATHLDVAMAIKNGMAKVGLGIMEAANIAQLDFIPLEKEEYDFLVHPSMKESHKIIQFIEFLKSDYFRDEVSKLDGYSLNNPGKVLKIKG
ncbi:MAG: substrate-binding domain-containing protein, partial [Cetobacterium sp.]